ncbi:MAG TPA: hypothetical protein VG929_03735 [Actinomycetota bacterium]|nr:hypothetical protein [Actinomycetota bacterium]
MSDKPSVREGKVRLAFAALLVFFGTLLIGPSFDFDTDRDGVADSIEIYERSTDPAEPDARFNKGLARRSSSG